jgi:hypothetical protein
MLGPLESVESPDQAIAAARWFVGDVARHERLGPMTPQDLADWLAGLPALLLRPAARSQRGSHRP